MIDFIDQYDIWGILNGFILLYLVYAKKKRIIIYPYLKKEEILYRIYMLNILIEYFKKNDYIFIVPIEKGADVSCLDYID